MKTSLQDPDDFVLRIEDAEPLTKAEGVEPDPKAQVPPDRRWPGWQVDELIARYWAPLLTAALAAGISTTALVSAWRALTRGWRRGDPVPDVGGWLAGQDVNPARQLEPVIRGIWVDGYVTGTRSAQAVLDHGTDPRAAVEIGVDWGDFVPGHVEAARRVLSADGRIVGLQQLLDHHRVTISRIAANRLDEIAAVLADGLEQGRTPAEIGQALEGVVADPRWAYMVAITETARASSAATLDQYERVGMAGKGWMTALDQRVCPVCLDNELQGIIPLGARFESGDPYPPGHPHCRCALIPGFDEPE